MRIVNVVPHIDCLIALVEKKAGELVKTALQTDGAGDVKNMMHVVSMY